MDAGFMKGLWMCALPLFLCSCWSYQSSLGSKSKRIFNNQTKPIAFKVNPDQCAYGWEILEKSGIYQFTADSAQSLKIKMKPTLFFLPEPCATGRATVLLFTLGQHPVKTEKKLVIEYDEIESGISTHVSYPLIFDKPIWFWDLFSIRKSDKGAASRQLKHEWVKKNALSG